MRVFRSVRLRSRSFGFLLGALLAIPYGSAQALSVSSPSFLTDGQVCASATVLACLTPLLQLDSAATITSGTVDITGGTLTFSFNLPSASFSGTDGAVTGATLSNVIYSGSFAVTPSGPTTFDFQDQLSNIAGTLTPTGAGSAAAFANVVNTTGQCVGSPGASLMCGFLFGPTGANVSVNGNTRYLRQSVNVMAVPEPGTALLLGLGLTALSVRRVRQR